MDLLADHAVRAEIRRAWQESTVDDPANRHEEGGYIVRNADGTYSVERWPRGEKSGIIPPPLKSGNHYMDREVIATFHTHPNPPIDEAGREWKEEPSERDQRWHARHRLRGYVIGHTSIYEIDTNGEFQAVGKREDVL